MNLGWLIWGVACIACSTKTDDSGLVDDSPPAPTGHEQLFVATGEYSASPSWHAVLRFDEAEAADAVVTPAATVPLKASTDAAGTKLLFGHGMYLWQSRNEMFVSTLFTNSANAECAQCMPTTPSGSIAVLNNITTADGAQTVVRHIFGGHGAGDVTGVHQPHGLWIDEPRDLLYVANTFGHTLLVFANASAATGNVAPARTLTSAKLGSPANVFLDQPADRLFVASIATGGQANKPAILIYNRASTRDGADDPDVRIIGTATRLAEGNNQTTHNVWYDPTSKLMFVGHHTNEILIYDLAGVDLDPAAPTDLELVPRVIQVNENDGDVASWSVYGLAYVAAHDRLYVSTGATMGGPKPGAPPNAIKVYDGVSQTAASGRVAPTRVIGWSNGTTYFPPQPLWVIEQ